MEEGTTAVLNCIINPKFPTFSCPETKHKTLEQESTQVNNLGGGPKSQHINNILMMQACRQRDQCHRNKEKERRVLAKYWSLVAVDQDNLAC